MGLNSKSVINYGGGGGNQLNTGPLPAIVTPLPGDFLIYTIMWQAGLPLGGYVPQAPRFSVSDDKGQQWINLFDLFQVGPGQGAADAYNAQYSMSVWFCPSAKGGTFNITTTSTAVPNLQDQQGHGSLLDWQLDNRNAVLNVSKLDATNINNPQLNLFSVQTNQLVIATFYSPSGGGIVLTSSSPGYTVLNSFGSVGDFHDEYIVRPATSQQPGIVTTRTGSGFPNYWLMTGLIIDISQPALQTSQIALGEILQMPIEE